MAESWEAHVAAVAALDEPTRRRLYDYVARQPESVSRDDAASALQLPRATAAFHLDRLADEGLLDVVHERRTGRTGPGAGRPSKLYHRSERQIAVSLPDRQYELAGHLLASAIQEADDSGESPRSVLARRAHERGRELGEAARTTYKADDLSDTVLRTLAAYGFEPHTTDGEVVLGNCPFHRLAKDYTDLVCAMNLRLLDGLLDGLDAAEFSARLHPAPGHCCVRLAPANS